jgi:hypothetical protein
MKKANTYINGNIDISGNNGQVFLGNFNNVIANLSSSGKKELANVLEISNKALMESNELPDDKKQELNDLMQQIGEESAKTKPNKTILKSLGDGLKSALELAPSVAKAIEPLLLIINKMYFG